MFAVFGMTEQYAETMARKHVKIRVGKRELTDSEYEEAKKEYRDKLMNSKKTAKVSPMLSTPDIANEWLALAEKYNGKRLIVKIYHPYAEEIKGGVKKIKKKWSAYVPGKDYNTIDKAEKTARAGERV